MRKRENKKTLPTDGRPGSPRGTTGDDRELVAGRLARRMLLLLTASLGAPGRPGGVHALRAAQIAAINSNASVHWRAAAQPRFASLAPGASANSNGVRGDWAADIREAIAKGEIEPFDGDANAEIPDEFDSETNWPACAKSAPVASPTRAVAPPSLRLHRPVKRARVLKRQVK